MEESRPPITKDEAQPISGSEKKRGFLMPFQDRLHELLGDKPDKTVEKEKKDSEKGNYGGRFRRMWGKLFGSIAEAEHVGDKRQTNLQETGLSDIFGEPDSRTVIEAGDTDRIEDVSDPEEVSPNVVEKHESKDEEAPYLGETLIQHDEPIIEESPPTRYEWAEPIIPEINNNEPLGITDTPKEVAPETEAPPTEFVTPILHYEDLQQPVTRQESLTPTPAEAAEDKRQARDEQSKEDRKRDEQTRKLKHEIRKQERKVERVVKNEAKTTREQQSRIPEPTLEPRVERVIEKVETVEPKTKTIIPEKKVSPEPKPPVRLETPVLERARMETPQLPRTPEVIVGEKTINPEKVLQEVATAAEHDEPLEKRYEQRHEIKDTDHVSNAVPIGSIVSEAYQKYNLQPSATAGNLYDRYNQDVRQRMQQQALQSNPQLYASAIRWGFWSAVAIIILGGLGLILFG